MSTLRERAEAEGINSPDLDNLREILKGDPRVTPWFHAHLFRCYLELMERADDKNLARLRAGFPATCEVLMAWYNTRPDCWIEVLDRESET